MRPRKSADSFDVIVIGLGIIGSAALNFVARSGARVLGIDRFAPPHTFGSSHGQTRLLRTAYANSGLYLPLVRESIRGWRALEARTNTHIFHQTGLIYIGDRDGDLLSRVRQTATTGGLNIRDNLSHSSKALQHFSDLPSNFVGILEDVGGLLMAEKAWTSFLSESLQAGASILANTCVTGIEESGNRYIVRTTAGCFNTPKIVVDSGPWVKELMPSMAGQIKVRRQVIHWYLDELSVYTLRRGFIPFVLQRPNQDIIYGVPSQDAGGFKIANHTVGQEISGPADINCNSAGDDCASMNDLVKCLFRRMGPLKTSTLCMYTMSPDGDFIIDEHPKMRGVWFMTGDSGHAFKFSPKIGEILGRGALGMPQIESIGAFSVQRVLSPRGRLSGLECPGVG